jgi:NDP-sugar pyrophosphorylase family protein
MSNIRNRRLETTGPLIEQTQVLILAGGRGTRLRSAFSEGPKSMAPVAGRHFLEYLLVWLRSAGFKDLILCVGYKKRQIQNWLGDGSRWKLRIRYSEEKVLLGTGGALKNAQDLISSQHCLVVNGDSFVDVDLRRMYRFHLEHHALATVVIARVRDSARYGAVRLNRRQEIVAFREKTASAPNRSEQQTVSRSLPINGGVYLFERRVFSFIPARTPISLEKQIFPTLIAKRLYGFGTRGYFIDIGMPTDFLKAQTELPKRIDLDHSS